MLKKTSLLLVTTIATLGFSAISNAAITKYGVTVSECDFDYENEKFCTDGRLKSYAKVLKNRKPNFDGNKIIYMFETNESGYTGKTPYRLVVIDTKTKMVYPFGYALSDATDYNGKPIAVNKKGETINFDFNVNSNRFCFSGNIDAYRMSQSYEQGKPFCFKYDAAEHGLVREF
ncbi:MAG: hypothetical protein Q4P13_06580 [Psychrobacter sp.]|nr:hypothetical protein [Psychrobacter sp.]